MLDGPKKARWYRLTPDRAVVALLALEGFLLLSAWFRWFPFNQHKGWPVLICMATVGAALLLMFLWFLAALAFRLRFQFSILSLLLLVVVVAVPFAWLKTEMDAARKQRETVEWFEQGGGDFNYDYQESPDHQTISGDATPPGPAWLRKVLGDDLFVNVTRVGNLASAFDDVGLQHLEGLTQLDTLILNDTKVGDDGLERLSGLAHLRFLWLSGTKVSDEGLRHLKGLAQLESLNLSNTSVSDAGLEQLAGLTRLEWLGLRGTKVTDKGAKELQQALPHCVIWDWRDQSDCPIPRELPDVRAAGGAPAGH